MHVEKNLERICPIENLRFYFSCVCTDKEPNDIGKYFWFGVASGFRNQRESVRTFQPKHLQMSPTIKLQV